MERTSLIFFGTEQFAAAILEGLLEDPAIQIVLVITQPDRPVGRKQTLVPPIVKAIADSHSIPCLQPETLKGFTLPVQADIAVTAQYGLLIPEAILDAPTHGVLNVHTSLLPKYRGATPIQSALIAGETETGVSIMKMDKGLDTGPILLQKRITIEPTDTYSSLEEKLAPLGIQGLREVLPLYIAGKVLPTPQDNSAASICKEFTRYTGRIDWQKPAADIVNLYRGTFPWPGVWTTWNGERIKVLQVSRAINAPTLSPGEVYAPKDMIIIGTGHEGVSVEQLQREGKKPTSAEDFLRGARGFDGSTLI